MPDVGGKIAYNLGNDKKVCLSLSQWWQIHWDFFNIEDIGETTHSHYIVIDTRGELELWSSILRKKSQSFPEAKGAQIRNLFSSFVARESSV